MTVRVVPWKSSSEGPKRWRVDIRFKKPDGSKVRNQTVYEAPTKGMAQRWGQSREGQLRDGSLVTVKIDSPPFDTFADDWIKVYPASAGNKATTIDEKTKHLKVHLKPYFGAITLDKIDRLTLDKFSAALLGKTKGKIKGLRTSRNGYLENLKPISRKRARNIMGTMHKLMVCAVEWGKLATLPSFPRIKAPSMGEAFDFYNVSEADLLATSARSDESILVLFALHTGARAGELLSLEWSDVDFAGGFVRFSKSATDGHVTEGTKGGRGRKVPMSATLAEALKTHRHLRGSHVFCKESGSALTLWHLHGALARASRKAGLRLLRWHDLRHSFASNLVIAGTPLRVVQAWMGHATIQMTMRYAHLAPDAGREYLVALDRGNHRGNALSASHNTA
jgi:integrase